jgi:hypothetical protein
MTPQLPRQGEPPMSKTIRQEKTKSTPAQAAKKPLVAKPSPHGAPPKGKRTHKTTGATKPAPARPGSKTSTILGLLKRPGGVTLKEIMKVTQWQAHSVRGFLSGTIGKKMGTPVESFKKGDERSYRIASK